MTDAESLIKEKARMSTEEHAWPPGYADGYVEGRSRRGRGEPPGAYLMVGIDEYALGFRAGYFQRKGAAITQTRASGSPLSDQLPISAKLARPGLTRRETSMPLSPAR